MDVAGRVAGHGAVPVRVVGTGPLADAIRDRTDGLVWVAWGANNPDLAIQSCEAELRAGNKVLCSTPLVAADIPTGVFYVVETVRAAHATDDFAHAPYIVVGGDLDPEVDAYLRELAPKVMWTTVETAAMFKHALNTMLALQVSFAAEITHACEETGADPVKVGLMLREDPRIGAKAYVLPGGDPGPHLMREVGRLCELGAGGVVAAL